jgi:pimeloyl-ACP methyl ester carboxylesterase
MKNDLEPFFTQRQGWQRIYFDMPGMGKSNQEGKWITSNDDMLEVILAFIDHVVPDRRFVIAGSSYGAYMARGVLYRRQAWIDGLLLMVPAILPRARRAVPSQITLVEDPALFSEIAPEVAEGYKALAVVQSRQSLDYFNTVGIPAVKLVDPELVPRLRANFAYSFAVDQLAEPFGGPTLIVTGRQDSDAGYQDAWHILENYPRATFVVLDRAGHMLTVEQEGLFTALVSEWLDRVEEYVS